MFKVEGVGKIILEGEEVEPYVLRDFDGVALFEIVDGQYRVERLDEQVSTDRDSVPSG